MCVTKDAAQGDSFQLALKKKQEEDEYRMSRKCGWFTVKYYNQLTLSGDKTRYLFVDEARYGIVWGNVSFFVIMHLAFFWGMWHVFSCGWTDLWVTSYFVGLWGGLGTTAGAHRLWSHKGYTASFPVRFFLMILFTSAGQNDLYTWARDHRLHHKFTETDADPHNSRRGGFFAHVGWLLTKKHPDVLIKGATIDNSDLMADPVVSFNRKFYIPLYLLCRVYLSMLLPYLMCGNRTYWECLIGCFSQYIGQLHTVWFVNSAAHIFGDRPYNSKIQPRENIFVAITGMGEGFHNYHHTFPWDYAIAENGISYWNPAKWFIDGCAYLSLTSKLKRASPELVSKTMAKVGGNHKDHDFYVHDHPYFQPHGYTDGA